ncbi:MAG: hypothetical protein ACOYEG_13185 [Petrimonas sp.]|jgi:hypothetical protein
MNGQHIMNLTNDEEYLIQKYRKVKEYERERMRDELSIKEHGSVLLDYFVNAPDWECRFRMIQGFMNTKKEYEEKIKIEKAIEYGKKQLTQRQAEVIIFTRVQSNQNNK